jgi:hypothetical protein
LGGVVVLGDVVVLAAPASVFFGAAALSFFGAASSFLSVVAGLPACSALDSLHIQPAMGQDQCSMCCCWLASIAVL